MIAKAHASGYRDGRPPGGRFQAGKAAADCPRRAEQRPHAPCYHRLLLCRSCAMDYQNLLVADRGAVRQITINRPDKLNALNLQTLQELDAAFRAAREDASVRVIVLAGSG